MLRNRRTVIFTMAFPVVFYLVFGLGSAYRPSTRYGVGNLSASTLVSMALYGAVLATTSDGAAVSIERARGWTRTLRVTPLTSAAYVAVKMATSLVLAAASVGAVYLVGAAIGKASMPAWVSLVTGLAVWVGSLLFGALGLFIPLSLYSAPLRTLAGFTPPWGLDQLVHYPLAGGSFDGWWLLSVAVWLAIFSGGAAWRFARATNRV